MSNTVTLTILLTAESLRENSKLLATMADCLPYSDDTDARIPTRPADDAPDGGAQALINELDDSTELSHVGGGNGDYPDLPSTPDTMPVSTGVELDSEGLPWDGRIHTPKRTKMKNGVWKVKRGTDPNLVEQVKAELKGTTDETPSTPSAAPPPPPADDVPPPPPPPPADLEEQEMNYTTVVAKIMARFTSKTLTQEQVQEGLSLIGVASLPALRVAPNAAEVIPTLWAYIDTIPE